MNHEFLVKRLFNQVEDFSKIISKKEVGILEIENSDIKYIPFFWQPLTT